MKLYAREWGTGDRVAVLLHGTIERFMAALDGWV